MSKANLLTLIGALERVVGLGEVGSGLGTVSVVLISLLPGVPVDIPAQAGQNMEIGFLDVENITQLT
jgi:hypothetical protein